MSEPTTQPLPAAVRLDRSRHAAPQVCERLREQILSLALAPGALLCRGELARGFGVSQTPVRDALMRLGEEGLVDIFPQHATVVSRINLISARQSHFLRLAIELEIVATLAGRPDAGLSARLRAAPAQQQALLDAGDFGGFSAADLDFHRSMYEAAEVPWLWDLVRRHSGHIDRLRRLHLPAAGKAQAIVDDHHRIVAAIGQQDAGAAQAALREHLSDTLGHLEEIRRRHPDFVTDG